MLQSSGMDRGEEKSEIDDLNEKLYSRTRYREPKDERKSMGEIESEAVEESWKSPNLNEMLAQERELPESHPFMKRIFVLSVVFFILAVGVAGYVFLGGFNFISSKNVNITITGPTNVSAGDLLDLGITISNRNNADLEIVDLSVYYPSGARDIEDTTKSLTLVKESLGSIAAGRDISRNIQTVLLGSVGDLKEIKFLIEYKVSGSNATFNRDKTYQITIGNSPITLTLDTPREVDSGAEFATTLTIALNSEKAMRGVLLKAEYPHGYTYVSAAPQPVVEENLWLIGDLLPGEKKIVKIQGRLLGEDNEERTFRFYVGVLDDGAISPNLKTIITASQNTIAIARPSVNITLVLNGENETNLVAPAGRAISGSIKFQNNLSEKVINPRIEARFSGSALDRFSVVARSNGFYDSISNKIIWQFSNLSGINELGPGEKGSVDFNFASLLDLPVTPLGREINIEAVFTGTPFGSPTNQTVLISRVGVVKISSEITLSSGVLYSRGPFKNHGPIPPKAEEETTYTIVWNIGNTQSDLLNARVTARLGQNVSWVGTSGSQGEDVAYDHSANIITWDLGALEAGAGFLATKRETAFQVSFKPSISQIGTSPVLVSSIVMTGTDSHSGSNVVVSNQPLTTKLVGDPIFVQGDDVVKK